LALLSHTQGIERALNRATLYRWGPRTIDLDILLYGEVEVKTTTLQIPHPELSSRAFVMIPLLELSSDLTLPNGTMVSRYLNVLTPPQKVRRIAPAAALAAL
jgi:2-amino-4-hydroxy-6-hydroxymethyldihydropteridine diphosphokinase